MATTRYARPNEFMTVMQKAQQPQRKSRRPRHTFHIKVKPWQLQPFAIMPILPGDTVQSLNHQSRCISDPIVNRTIGWHAEYYYAYVPHAAMPGGTHFQAMMLDSSYDTSSQNVAANVKTYHGWSTIDWTMQALQTCVEEWFRFEGESFNTGETSIDGVPHCGLIDKHWLQSAVKVSDVGETIDVLPGDTPGDRDQNVPDHLDPAFVAAFAAWQDMVEQQQADLTYDDFLRTHGIIRPQVVQDAKPEMLKIWKDWTYPVSAIDPTDGSAASAVQWSSAFRVASEKFFFKEPGFLIGFQCIRPKLYRANQVGSAVDLMNDALTWLPPALRDEVYTSLIKADEINGPLDIATFAEDYWIDIKDLLLYGDQFVNIDVTSGTVPHFAGIPKADFSRRFPGTQALDALFVNAVGGFNQLVTDGVVSASIMSRVGPDTTPAQAHVQGA